MDNRVLLVIRLICYGLLFSNSSLNVLHCSSPFPFQSPINVLVLYYSTFLKDFLFKICSDIDIKSKI